MLGAQHFSGLNCSSFCSPVSSSLADNLLERGPSQKLKQEDDYDDELPVHGNTDPGDHSPPERLEETVHQPTSTNSRPCELQNDRQGTAQELSGPAHNGHMDAVLNMTFGSADHTHENLSSGDVSLRYVLSDNISGSLMEDAMITPCGHSFGARGLHRVMEKNNCLTCGAPVPSDSLIPNYALRAAVLAYKRESKRKKKELSVQAGNYGRRFSGALDDSDTSRLKGVQFPYVANDRVLIKGNKRTPERFVGREAIISTQCLNGWYLVKTLDNGESVRLQYRSLQKIRDKETLAELDARVGKGKLTENTCKINCLKGPSMSTFVNSISADCKEGSPSSHLTNKIRAGSFPSGLTKGMRSESPSRTNQTNCGPRGRNQLQTADASGGSWHNGGTCSNSSQELQGEQVKKVLDLHNLQVHGMYSQEAVTMYDSGEERGSKRFAPLGTAGVMVDGLATHSTFSVCKRKAIDSKQSDYYVAEMKASKEVKTVNDGEQVSGSNFQGGRSQGKHSRARPKHNFLSARPDLQKADPYKKVYVSGVRRRASSEDGHGLIASKQSALASLNTGADHCCGLLDAEMKTTGESNGSVSLNSYCEMIRKGMLDLETQIPWSCKRRDWKTCRADWLQMLHKSDTLKDVGARLEELRGAFILEKAGNMSDDEWNEKLEEAVELEAVNAVDYLWKRLQEDICKLNDFKLRGDGRLLNMKFDLQEFTDSCIDGLSPVGIIAATSLAAADAYAVGEQDIETLLAIPMKLVQEHNNQDLTSLIDAIDREKRHLSAKILNLGSSNKIKAHLRIEDVDNMLVENSTQVHTSSLYLAVEMAPCETACSNNPPLSRKDGRCMDHDVGVSLADADSHEEVVRVVEEETDLSDSE